MTSPYLDGVAKTAEMAKELRRLPNEALKHRNYCFAEFRRRFIWTDEEIFEFGERACQHELARRKTMGGRPADEKTAGSLPDERDSPLRDRRSEMNAPQTLTPADLSALREAAEKATPGPWRGGHRCDGALRTTVDGARVSIAEIYAQADAAYIALCSPDRILALLGMLDEARETIKDLECQDEIRCLGISIKRKERDAALSQLSTAIRERDEAIGALRPFGEAWDNALMNWPKDCAITLAVIKQVAYYYTEATHYTRARAILAASDKKDSTDV